VGTIISQEYTHPPSILMMQPIHSSETLVPKHHNPELGTSIIMCMNKAPHVQLSQYSRQENLRSQLTHFILSPGWHTFSETSLPHKWHNRKLKAFQEDAALFPVKSFVNAAPNDKFPSCWHGWGSLMSGVP